MTTVFTPWHNANSLRSYPFADHATRTARQGVTIPQDVFVDLAIYPANVGTVRVVSIDGVSGLVTFGDGTDRIAEATYVPGAAESAILETAAPYRPIGVVIFGAGAAAFFASSGLLTFTGTSGQLANGTVFPANQAGVRGIRLPDGTVVTGDVCFKGENGVAVTVSDSAGLRIDVVGASGTSVAECMELPTVVRSIRVIVRGTSRFGASKVDENTLALTYRGGDIDALCSNNDKFAQAPDPCDPVPVPDPVVPADYTLDFALTDGIGFNVVAPSGLDYRNPISLEPIEHGVNVKIYGL